MHAPTNSGIELQVDHDIWTMDGPEVVFAGAPMHTRMTVVRLNDRRLWVHSPIELTEDVQAFIDSLGGQVAVLIAPNKFHHLFIDSWRKTFPGARVFAEETLMRKVPALANAEILTSTAPGIYSSDIDQVIFGGNRLFQEAVFFHKPSGALILTDLMVNLKTDRIKGIPRLFLRFEGITYPNGGVPRLYRWFSHDKPAAREALQVIKTWNPTRILFCHGESFDLSAADVLNREFAFLDTGN